METFFASLKGKKMAVAAIAAVATAVISAAGAVYSASAQSSAASQNAKIAQRNADLQAQNSLNAQKAGQEQAHQQEEKTRATIGAIKAGQAASGINIGEGSALDVQNSASELGQQDAITIRNNAAKQAYGYDVGAGNSQMQSSLYKSEASSAMTSGYLSAGSSLIGGASNAYSEYLKS